MDHHSRWLIVDTIVRVCLFCIVVGLLLALAGLVAFTFTLL